MTEEHVAATVVASFLAGLNANADGSAIRDLAALAPALDLWRSVLQTERRQRSDASNAVKTAVSTGFVR